MLEIIEPSVEEVLAVEARGLTKKFGRFVAVDHLNLNIRKGENFGLLGPNGAGKTTTIRMITGVIKPTEGYVKVFGIDVAKERKKVLRLIGYMPQKFSLYEDLTVEENLKLYGRLQGLIGSALKERVRYLLEKFYLWEFRRRLAGKLSGGMKQRLALATALVHNPELLILDEPTAGVDPPLRRKFWEYFRELNSEGKTILVTTHYMDEAENCDRLALMNRGRIIAEGTPQEIKRKALGGDLVEIKFEGNLDPLKLPGVKLVVEGTADRYLLVVEDAGSYLPQVVRRAEELGAKVLVASPVYVSLEEAFIRFMGEEE
ncbi:MAG TPA: ABC transporter ATP-binding protein [Candidatus Korarchaeota archaeon]|nr:ABC transporter ATP-binding protein [Candidatus Korarchaeota archaeon]